MNHFQAARCGFSSQESANTTARKIAKSVVGNSIYGYGGGKRRPRQTVPRARGGTGPTLASEPP